MKQEILEQSILASLEYYHCFEWPLSTFELYSRLIPPIALRGDFKKTQVTLQDIVGILHTSPRMRQYIHHVNGSWFFRGKEHLYARRIEATKETEEKLKRLFVYRRVFLGTPFLRGAFVSGSVACGWPSKESDIDLLIVAKSGRIWTTRLFLTFYTSFLGIRRKGKRVANQLCLNHYITDDALCIPFESLYNAHTYINLIPLVNEQHVFERFFKENIWIQDYFSNPLILGESVDYTYSFPVNKFLERCMHIKRPALEWLLQGFVGNLFERLAKRIQLYFIQRNPLTPRRGGRITAQDFQLEFHPQSKENIVLTRYNKKLKELGLEAFYPEKDSGLE